jgi:hypothetical protein
MRTWKITPRRVWITVGGAAFVGVLAVTFLYYSNRAPGKVQFTRAMYDRLQLGMTQEQVEEVLGVPNGDYSTTATQTWIQDMVTANTDFSKGRVVKGKDLCRKDWKSDTGVIAIQFIDGRAVMWYYDRREPPTLHMIHEWMDEILYAVGF